ncbi:MAG: Amino acid/amide ABC transporter ATP-binding protein 1, HAAT family [Thermotoga sp. 50_1627]|nr:MAG: Amino acid/amide ABC transporter ATP-binding protein 1, HAAT family [Thermotoga sp. 50_64]KUK25441.1 MAG: Amino acid/amide ABC transporter ATP-binding protein 1, HAAT family [Thermotoga sp. 50_1627]MDK2923424.1 branched-chain amino acid transport system ATP-binding protein [Pseudothermotoga sp.]
MAVDNFSMKVEKGEIHSLIGPNGAGKTTVFNAITRVVRIHSGTIVLDGVELTRVAPHQVISYGVARTFQNVVMFKYLTVLENFYVGYHHRIAGGLMKDLIVTKQRLLENYEMYREALNVADFLGLKSRLLSYAGSIPYFHQKLVEIGRALMARPKLLLLDEPAAGLNEAEENQLVNIIRRIRDEMGVTVLLIEHDMRVVMDISDVVTVMDFGKKISEGKPEMIRKDPRVISAYLGEIDSA